MKAAILGNGPSRVAYTPADYDLVLGCNFPWCPVDAAVIIDPAVIEKYVNHPDLIESIPGVYLTTPAQRHLMRRAKRRKSAATLLNRCLGVFTRLEWESSGHVAAQVAIDAGATELWIFGCDSYFEYTVESCTASHISNNIASPDRYVYRWRNLWQCKVNKHPHVKFNFVRDSNDYTTAIPENLPTDQKR